MHAGSRSVLAVSLVLFPLVAAAQEKQPPAGPRGTVQLAQKDKAAEATGTDKSDPGAEFAALFAQWRGLLEKLTELKERFQTDPAADKKALSDEFNSTLAEANAMGPKLTASAMAAYAAAPNKSQDLNNFLIANLRGLVSSDDYEPAAKMARLMVDNKFEHRALDYFAGLAFFATSDFDAAAKHLQAAKDAGKIEPIAERYLKACEKYKELWAKEKAIRAKEDKADDLPKVKFSTSKGDIVVEVLENEAPNTAANFISLVDKKFYDGLKFHRVLEGFMAQGGDPNGDGSGGPGYTIPDECRQDNHRNHFRGTLSMAKTAEPDTGGSQFFLTFVPTSHLDGKHTVFGRVVEGMDVLAKLQRVQPGQPDVTPDRIIKATVIRKRDHKYEPLKKVDKEK